MTTGGTTYAIKKIPVMSATSLTCQEALKKNTTIEHEPHGVRYKGKKVFEYYCKTSKGEWVKWMIGEIMI